MMNKPLLIDVRSEHEFATASVEGAVNLPLGQLEQRIRDVAVDPRTPLVLYCASGARSGMGCMMLSAMGYTDVRNAGSLFAAAGHLQRGIR